MHCHSGTAFFQVIAQITTTGFATTDYMAVACMRDGSFMFLLMFAGGCTGLDDRWHKDGPSSCGDKKPEESYS
ncbi:MAG: hypothetical protein MZV63_29625 [Marinilabiliales bacterium]|nr:hypothetical protein [Marinilabiliales bacterium]